MSAQSLFEKVWASHIVAPETDDTPAVLYVDLHLMHEVTLAAGVRRAARARPARCAAPTARSRPGSLDADAHRRRCSTERRVAIELRPRRRFGSWRTTARTSASSCAAAAAAERGIVHVIGPELGATQPGTTIVCGDSHTSTHGAFGALAFGIGTTEVGHVLATQCLLQRKPKTLAINVDGKLRAGRHRQGPDPAR